MYKYVKYMVVVIKVLTNYGLLLLHNSIYSQSCYGLIW